MKKINLSRICLKRSVLLFLVCLMWVGLFSQVSASQYRNTITGFVFGPQRSPVTQIPIEVLNEVNQVLQRTRTDGSGRYFFSGLSAGRFLIRVTPYGTNFEEQTAEVEIINFVRPGSSTSENAQKDIYLRIRNEGKDANTITGTLFVQEIPQDARRSYEKAMTHFQNKNDSAAIDELLLAVKAFPEYFAALERLGREYIKQQNYSYARAAFTKAVSVNERSFGCWYGLSYALYALKMPDVAIQAAQNASKINPSSVEALLILGISQRQAKLYNEAEKTLLQAKKFAKNLFPDVHWNLALLYNHNLKRYQAAADELELYLKIQPNDAKTEDIKKLIAQLRSKS